MEKAISLRGAAELLGVSYQTIFQHRQRIGFRLPGGRIWRVLPSRLAELAQPRYNVTRLSLRVEEDNQCQSAKMKKQAFGASTSARQAEKELDALLARPTGDRRRNFMTA